MISPTEPTPEGIDWDAWLGPAPMRGFNKILCPDDVHNHFPAWRRYREYCNGAPGEHGSPSFRHWPVGYGCRQYWLSKDHSPPKEGSRDLKMICKWS